ncbi:hypothetical protein J2X02_003074 [Pseudoxanthomonas japonensis]|uniref:hypothetical protein n=1 Tax=Pseudoxanthomonas TaxID=83618 RepID=UPI000A7059B1|nr:MULTISPECIES: hypothetical protein [Pseudoxanthomonas]MBL8255619.1 hypothetical protein [Pseudoxanthomonas mexicana]MDR7070209.1 hypothetical protein [Pseudoxanthomonas japonensis]
MPATRIPHVLIPLMLASLLTLAAQPAGAKNTRVDSDISADLADARHDVRTELAAARRKLETGNLALGSNLQFGKSGKRSSDEDHPLPKAEITPQGDFLIEGKPVAIDRTQRQELLRYRGQVIEIAKTGIDIGERSAQAALDAVDRGLFSLMVGAMTGSLERRVEKTVRETVEPGVRQICRRLPALRDTQQRLSASLPQFRPYATLDADAAEDCEQDLRQEFATR